MKNSIAVPRRLIQKFLRKMLPLAKEVSDLFQQNAEDDGLTPRLREWIERYQVKTWADAYEDPTNYFRLHAAALAIQDEPPKELLPPSDLQTVEDVQAWVDKLCDFFERYLDDDSDGFEFMDAETPDVIAGTDEDGQPVTRQGLFLSCALILVFNYFAVMVHRQSMFQLVARAKKGDKEAFRKAVQIDHRCLKDIPYFRDRMRNASEEGNVRFLQRVAQCRRKPMFDSGTELRQLYLALALLESMHMLDAFTADQAKFAAFCQSEGIYGSDDDSEDVVDSLMRAVRRFKSQYQSLAKPLSSKTKLVVKDTK